MPVRALKLPPLRQFIVTQAGSNILSLDEYQEAILRPMVNQLQARIANAIMNGTEGGLSVLCNSGGFRVGDVVTIAGIHELGRLSV